MLQYFNSTAEFSLCILQKYNLTLRYEVIKNIYNNNNNNKDLSHRHHQTIMVVSKPKKKEEKSEWIQS